jgi:hypothetical protein
MIFKGAVAGDMVFSHVVLIFIGSMQGLILTHKENTQSEIFLLGKLKFNCILLS